MCAAKPEKPGGAFEGPSGCQVKRIREMAISGRRWTLC